MVALLTKIEEGTPVDMLEIYLKEREQLDKLACLLGGTVGGARDLRLADAKSG